MSQVVRLEFPGDLAEQLLNEHAGTRVEYYYRVYYRQY